MSLWNLAIYTLAAFGALMLVLLAVIMLIIWHIAKADIKIMQEYDHE